MPCVRSSTVKTKLGRGGKESFSPATLFAGRRGTVREKWRESRESGNCFWPTLFARWKPKDIVGLR